MIAAPARRLAALAVVAAITVAACGPKASPIMPSGGPTQAPSVAPADRPVAVRFTWAFALLALGDTGHVGFRVGGRWVLEDISREG